jgi:methylmalonyl-CoA/ethylmalonyl-CoA epimerase
MPDLSQSRIGQIAIVCRDVARATTFYRDALGLRFLFAAGPTLSFFDAGGTRLMLSTGEGEHDHPGSMLYFFINDIEGTCDELARRGVSFIDKPHMIAKMPDHDLWLAAFRDTEGNTMAVMEEKR